MSLNDSPHAQEWPPIETMDLLESINDKLSFMCLCIVLYAVSRFFMWLA